MQLSEIKEILKAEQVTGKRAYSGEIKLAAASDLMSDLLTNINPPDILLTGLSNIQVVRTATITGIDVIVIVRNKNVDDKVIQTARDEAIIILKSKLSLFETCGLLFNKGVRSIWHTTEE